MTARTKLRYSLAAKKAARTRKRLKLLRKSKLESLSAKVR